MHIQEAIFGPKQYLTVRKAISISQVSDHDMYDQAGKKLGAYMSSHNLTSSGPWSVLYFKWDIQAGQAEIGISFPIDNLGEVEDEELVKVEVLESKAILGVLEGPYEGLNEAHQAMNAYIKEHALSAPTQPPFAIEEYVKDPMTEPDQTKLITNIYYLIK